MKGTLRITLLITFLLISCARADQIPTPTTLQAHQFPLKDSTPSPPVQTPETFPSAESDVKEEPTEIEEYILSADAGKFLGQQVTVIMPSPSCSYKKNINGSPTFCNDEPYPDHNFTLLVWGEDWSFLDGKCILVTGEVSEYDGKYQIIATDLSQIAFC